MLALSPLPSALCLLAMSSRRVLKAAEAIREVVSMAILTDLRDPRIEGVTVTRVEVSPDMRQAKVHVSIMGNEAQQKLCLHGLRNSAGYLQSKISDRIDTRYTPKLSFALDEGVKKSLAISQMLRELLPGDGEADDKVESGEADRSEDEN
jgi:ribosome-binding factor A